MAGEEKLVEVLDRRKPIPHSTPNAGNPKNPRPSSWDATTCCSWSRIRMTGEPLRRSSEFPSGHGNHPGELMNTAAGLS